MNVITIDRNKEWLKHCLYHGVPAYASLDEARGLIEALAGDVTVLLDVRLLCLAPELEQLGVKRIVVTTTLPTVRETIRAYQAGGHNHRVVGYVVKDFGKDPRDAAEEMAGVSEGER